MTLMFDLIHHLFFPLLTGNLQKILYFSKGEQNCSYLYFSNTSSFHASATNEVLNTPLVVSPHCCYYFTFSLFTATTTSTTTTAAAATITNSTNSTSSTNSTTSTITTVTAVTWATTAITTTSNPIVTTTTNTSGTKGTVLI